MNGTNDSDGTSADIILQSTDNGYLRTSKVMLSNASDLFKTMFSLPQPPDQEFMRDGLAVIPIDADTSLLQNLLSFCNPPEMVRLPELQRAAMKYQRYWWREYIYAARNALQKRPCGSTVQSGEIFERALKEGSRCRNCSPDLGRLLREFVALFAGDIDNAVSLVRLVYA